MYQRYERLILLTADTERHISSAIPKPRPRSRSQGRRRRTGAGRAAAGNLIGRLSRDLGSETDCERRRATSVLARVASCELRRLTSARIVLANAQWLCGYWSFLPRFSTAASTSCLLVRCSNGRARPCWVWPISSSPVHDRVGRHTARQVRELCMSSSSIPGYITVDRPHPSAAVASHPIFQSTSVQVSAQVVSS